MFEPVFSVSRRVTYVAAVFAVTTAFTATAWAQVSSPSVTAIPLPEPETLQVSPGIESETLTPETPAMSEGTVDAIASGTEALSPQKPAAAQASEVPAVNPFVVDDVPIEATAKNAVDARNEGIIQGQQTALKMLAERMLSKESADSMATPDPATLAALLQDFEVREERLSANGYRAKMRATFNPGAVERFFGAAKMTPVDISARSVMVLPLYEVGGEYLLWEDTNPWISAWQKAEKPGYKLIVPTGDLEDVTAAPASKIMGGDYGPVDVLKKRYGVDDVYVAVARKSAALDLPVEIYGYHFGQMKILKNARAVSGDVAAADGEKTPAAQTADDDVFATAVALSNGIIRDDIKVNVAAKSAAQNPPPSTGEAIQQQLAATPPADQRMGSLVAPPLTQGGPVFSADVAALADAPHAMPGQPRTLPDGSHSLPVKAVFGDIATWVDIQRRLSAVPGVSNVLVTTVGRNEAEVTLNITGMPGAWRAVFSGAGLTLMPPVADGLPYRVSLAPNL